MTQSPATSMDVVALHVRRQSRPSPGCALSISSHMSTSSRSRRTGGDGARKRTLICRPAGVDSARSARRPAASRNATPLTSMTTRRHVSVITSANTAATVGALARSNSPVAMTTASAPRDRTDRHGSSASWVGWTSIVVPGSDRRNATVIKQWVTAGSSTAAAGSSTGAATIHPGRRLQRERVGPGRVIAPVPVTRCHAQAVASKVFMMWSRASRSASVTTWTIVANVVTASSDLALLPSTTYFVSVPPQDVQIWYSPTNLPSS